jgi:putative hemolysin
VKKEVARDISYSSSAKSKAGRAVIRSIENITGRISLIKKAKDYENEVAAGRDFWEVILEKYNIRLNILGGSLENIPKKGPVVVVANHPYGILDGLMLGYILSTTRTDFRILAHRVFKKAQDLDKVILPINFDETRDGMAQNIETRKKAISYLSTGGCVGIFPGGTVSTSVKPFGKAMDPSWRKFTARLIAKSKAQVVPIYFEGSNSRLFQIASHLHYNLRMALLIKEFRRRTNDKVSVVVGEAFADHRINEYKKSAEELMNFLRTETYKLSPEKTKGFDKGFDFDI